MIKVSHIDRQLKKCTNYDPWTTDLWKIIFFLHTQKVIIFKNNKNKVEKYNQIYLTIMY
jgi:hypothetical protein